MESTLVTYKTLDEMVEKAKYYLEHDNEREKIAKSGYEEFISKHTYRHRIEKILEIIK
jgi:spore maturation protein CgeB